MVSLSQYIDSLSQHYRNCWKGKAKVVEFSRGPVQELPDGFRVARFKSKSGYFVYATLGLGAEADQARIELHILSPRKDDFHLPELLYAIAHCHTHGAQIGLHHTVKFGQGWLPGSKCTFGLISLPYLFGPSLEHFNIDDGHVHCLWLLPITEAEKDLATSRDVEALESIFEEKGLDYLDEDRPSLV